MCCYTQLQEASKGAGCVVEAGRADTKGTDGAPMVIMHGLTSSVEHRSATPEEGHKDVVFLKGNKGTNKMTLVSKYI